MNLQSTPIAKTRQRVEPQMHTDAHRQEDQLTG